MSKHYIPISSAKDGNEGNVTTNCSSNSKNCDSHGESDSTSNSTPPSVTSSVGTRLTDYFEKMSEMQKKAFEKLYESASNGPCQSSNSSDGPCHALVVCEQSLEQNFKDMVSKRKQKFPISMFLHKEHAVSVVVVVSVSKRILHYIWSCCRNSVQNHLRTLFFVLLPSPILHLLPFDFIFLF